MYTVRLIERLILILLTPQHEFQNVVKEVLLGILDMIYA